MSPNIQTIINICLHTMETDDFALAFLEKVENDF